MSLVIKVGQELMVYQPGHIML